MGSEGAPVPNDKLLGSTANDIAYSPWFACLRLLSFVLDFVGPP